MKRNRLAALLAALLLTVGLLPGAQAAEEETASDGSTAPETSATSTIVVDAWSGRVLYEDNADEQRPIASVTKIMTGYLATETLTQEDLSTVYTISEHAAASDGVDGTSMYFEAGDEVSVEVLLYGTMLRSGNDAAVALAEVCAGDEQTFIDRMNAKAEELGMTNTHFSSVNGLVDENNYSTARDLAVLGRAAMQNELFAQIVGTWYIEIDGYSIENHNMLLSDEYMGRDECLGIKTGFTTAAGRTLVSCAQRDGSRFIVVTLNDANDYEDHMALYEWAFENYPANVLCEEGEVVTTLHVGEQDVPLVAAETLVSSVEASDEANLSCSMTLPGRITGTVSQGSVAGTITFTLNGETLGTVELLYDAIVVS